jgi:hypothetical protein
MNGLGIVIAAALIAGSLAIGSRYMIVSGSTVPPDPDAPRPLTGGTKNAESVTWRLDRWTGKTWACYSNTNRLWDPICKPVVEDTR